MGAFIRHSRVWRERQDLRRVSGNGAFASFVSFEHTEITNLKDCLLSIFGQEYALCARTRELALHVSFTDAAVSRSKTESGHWCRIQPLPYNAWWVWKHSFISMARPTVVINPSQKRSFSSKTRFKPGEFDNAGFSTDLVSIENMVKKSFGLQGQKMHLLESKLNKLVS